MAMVLFRSISKFKSYSNTHRVKKKKSLEQIRWWKGNKENQPNKLMFLSCGFL